MMKDQYDSLFLIGGTATWEMEDGLNFANLPGGRRAGRREIDTKERLSRLAGLRDCGTSGTGIFL